MIGGSPSSGKTSTACAVTKKLGQDTIMLSQDTFMEELGGIEADSEEVFNSMLTQLKELLCVKKNVIIEGTLNTIRNNSFLIDLFINHCKESNHTPLLVYLDASFETVEKRWQTKDKNWKKNLHYTGNLKEWHSNNLRLKDKGNLIIDVNNKEPDQIADIIIKNIS